MKPAPALLAVSLLLFPSLSPAQNLPEAEERLRSRDYAGAAGLLANVPADAGDAGYVAWLRGSALLRSGKAAEAVTVCAAVPPESKWRRKARLLQAVALTELKRREEAAAIYAEEAAAALSPERKDELAGLLTAFAEELTREPDAAETEAAKPDPARAARLYQQALEMEFLSPGFRDGAHYKLAVTLQSMGQPENALTALNDYLIEFDKDWTPLTAGNPETGGARGDAGPAREKSRDAKRFLQPGAHTHDARLRVAQCLLALGKGDASLRTLDMFLKLEPAPEPAKRAEAAWLRCRVLGLPRGMEQTARNAIDSQIPEDAPPADPARHTEALRAFLTAWPTDSHAPEAARRMGENLLTLDKAEEGVAALTDFVAGRGYQFDAAAEANRAPDKATGLTPADRLERWKQEAVFRIARLRFDRKEHAEAIAKWREYTVNYPNGARWAAAQQGIMDAEFEQGIAAAADGNEARATELFDGFLTRYPLDERARRILFIYGQFSYAAAQAGETADREKAADAPLSAKTLGLFQTAMERWARLTAKYPETEESSLALYNTGLILTEKLNRLEDGLAVFRRLRHGQWAESAKERAAILEEKSLAVSAPRVFRTNETPHVAVSARNVKKLKVSRYPLELEGWLRGAHRLDGLEKLDVDLIAPEKTWEVEVADYAPWRGCQQNIDIPFPDETAGACVVRVEGDDWQATTLVVRSDIELITEATRGEVLVFAVNARENQPAADATVLISDGAKIIATGKTGADGVFRHRAESLPDVTRAFVLTPRGAMVSGLNLASLTVTKAPSSATHTTFDRQEYLPGQTARYLIVRHRIEGAKRAAEIGKVTLRVLSPEGKLVTAAPAEWAADGSLQGAFLIPRSAREGMFKVQVLNPAEEVIVSAPFTVAAPPDANIPLLTLKLEQGIVKPGGVTKAELLVDWPQGLPLADEEVEITFPDGSTARHRTDAGGVLKFEVTATPGVESHRTEYVTASLPRRPGSRKVAGLLIVNPAEWSLFVRPSPAVVRGGETFSLRVGANGFDGAPLQKSVKGGLYRLTAPPPSRVLEGVPWISYTPPAAAEEKVEEFTLTTDAATGEVAREFTLSTGGHYVARFTGEDGKAKTERRFYVAGASDPHGLRIDSPATAVNEGAVAKLRLHSAKERQQVLVTVAGDVFLSHQILSVPAGATEIAVPVAAEHAPNFRVTAVARDGRFLESASAGLTVRRGLKIDLTAPAKMGDAPGVAVTDLAGNPVKASVLAAVLSASPDPDAPLLTGHGFLPQPVRDPLPTRRVRLALHSSAALLFPGASVRVDPAAGGARITALNDQERLVRVLEQEIRSNRVNSQLEEDNNYFIDLNCFVQSASPGGSGSGALIFAEGVRRGRDGFTQSFALPAVPDSDGGSGTGGSFDVVSPARLDRARLFTSAPGKNFYDLMPENMALRNAAPSQQSFATEGGASHVGLDGVQRWSVSRDGPPALDVSRLNDGRWALLVRAWTPEQGITQQAIEFTVRHSLGLAFVAPGALAGGKERGIAVLTNRDGMSGEVKLFLKGAVRGGEPVTLDGERRRGIFEIRLLEGEGRGLELRAENLPETLGMGWYPKALAVPAGANSAIPRRTVMSGGVLTGPADITLDVPGVFDARR